MTKLSCQRPNVMNSFYILIVLSLCCFTQVIAESKLRSTTTNPLESLILSQTKLFLKKQPSNGSNNRSQTQNGGYSQQSSTSSYQNNINGNSGNYQKPMQTSNQVNHGDNLNQPSTTTYSQPTQNSTPTKNINTNQGTLKQRVSTTLNKNAPLATLNNSTITTTNVSKPVIILHTNYTIPYFPLIDYTRQVVDKCDETICKKGNGICKNETVCECLPGRANVPLLSDGVVCDYIQRKQLIAFLFELCLSCGIGYFYIGTWWLGMIKLLVVVLIPTFFCSMMICSDLFMKGYKLMIILFSVTGGLYWLSDVILFGVNFYRDGNGVPLQHW